MSKLEYTKEDIIDIQNDIDKLYQENKELKAIRDKAIKCAVERDKLQQENKELQTTVNNCKQRINKAIDILGKYKHYSSPDEKQNSDNEDIVNNAYEVLKRKKIMNKDEYPIEEELEEYMQMCKKLQVRIDKAIEYIKSLGASESKILDILKGEENENKTSNSNK